MKLNTPYKLEIVNNLAYIDEMVVSNADNCTNFSFNGRDEKDREEVYEILKRINNYDLLVNFVTKCYKQQFSKEDHWIFEQSKIILKQLDEMKQ